MTTQTIFAFIKLADVRALPEPLFAYFYIFTGSFKNAFLTQLDSQFSEKESKRTRERYTSIMPNERQNCNGVPYRGLYPQNGFSSGNTGGTGMMRKKNKN